MKTISKLSAFICLFFLIISASPLNARADDINNNDINIYFFWGKGCPHCESEKKFLDNLKKEVPKLKIIDFEIWNDTENAKLLGKISKEMDFKVSGVPVTIVGDKVFSGFYTAETTGKEIREVVNYYLNQGCVDQVSNIINNQTDDESKCIHSCDQDDEECRHDCGCKMDQSDEQIKDKIINIPIFGEVNAKNFSLPILTIIIAAVDGFNPCAMWVLLFLISLLLGMKDRKKMWILGTTFILSSGIVYFLFLSAWLNLFLFLGFIFWIRIAIGVVAIGSGIFHIKEFFTNRKGTCHVTGGEKRKLVFEKIRNIINKENFLLSLLGIVILAAAVNLIELICSAGLPAVYTQILALSDLVAWKYYAYLVLYILIFMLDDMIIFVLAMLALQMKTSSSKFSVWANLIGGLIILILGILLIFKPGLIMFG